MQFGEKRTNKHFEKQQNAVWRKNELTNISKNSQMRMQFGEKQNGQTFRKTDMYTCSLRKKQTDKHFNKISKKKQMQF